MGARWKKALNIGIWSLAAVYLVVAYAYSGKRKKEDTCKQIVVSVSNPAMQFLSPFIVKSWYDELKLPGKKLNSINTYRVEKIAKERAYVKAVKAYISKPDKLHIEVTQRAPVIRLCSAQGHNIYLDETLFVLPFQRQFVAQVPLVTGNIPLPFNTSYFGPIENTLKSEKKSDKNYLFLTKLINFVEFIRNDSFWNAFIVQVNVTDKEDIELVPRAGDQVVLLGGLDNYEPRMDKLLKFYEAGKGEWEKYKYINVKFRNQIICSK